MTDKPSDSLIASVRQRLMNLRGARGGDYNTLLSQYAIERFLYRLSKSKLADQFVLKGAMLFRAWSGELHRPTKDLDLLGQGESTPEAVATAIRSILGTPVSDDGIVFEAESVAAEEIREAQEYGGIRVKLTSYLGNARIPMQVDVGFGDAVTPQAQVAAFPTLLDMDAPRLRMYPPETVVAEKLEAIVSLGIANSRMKDFYDLLVIFRAHDLDDEVLSRAIAATFRRRQTTLSEEVPVGLSDDFGQDVSAKQLWREFVRRLHIGDATDDFGEVIKSIRDRVWPAIEAARTLG